MLALLIAAAAPSAFDATVAPDRIVLLCDPRRFRLSVRASADAGSVDRTYPERRLIDPADLIFPLPQVNGSTDLRGYLVRFERCGPYTVELEGDAYNVNVQGEAGAYDSFANVRVLWGAQTIYPAGLSTRLTSCDRSLPRARPCPDGYAVRIDGRYNPAAKTTRFDEYTESDDETAQGDSQRRTIQHYSADTDRLPELWALSGER